jgi:hypothetical protein
MTGSRDCRCPGITGVLLEQVFQYQRLNGAPRPTKMGTTRSPWRYDNHAEDAIRTTAMRAGCRGYAPIFGLEAIE